MRNRGGTYRLKCHHRASLFFPPSLPVFDCRLSKPQAHWSEKKAALVHFVQRDVMLSFLFAVCSRNVKRLTVSISQAIQIL